MNRTIGALMLAGVLPGCIMVHARTVEEPAPVASVAPVAAVEPPRAPLVAPPPGAVAPPPLQVANPSYVTIPMEIIVNRPVKDVWARIGKYCDIAEWFQIATGCEITSGKDGEVGAVRTVGAEILVAKTEYSYAYTQPVREGRPYNLYHGNLEARAIDANTTKLLYTLIYDLSLVPGDEAAKAADVQRRHTAFTRALGNMKILAEGGTLPPPPARN
jgi:Polyketide cyclase / dehydrase and lipid transport